MFNILLDLCLLFLLFYAIYQGVKKICDTFMVKNECEHFYALIIPEETESFEYSIRCALEKASRLGVPLTVIDKGLSNEARYILDALSGEFSLICVLTFEEFIKKIT